MVLALIVMTVLETTVIDIFTTITNNSEETDFYHHGHCTQVKRVKGNDKIQGSKGKKKGDFNA